MVISPVVFFSLGVALNIHSCANMNLRILVSISIRNDTEIWLSIFFTICDKRMKMYEVNDSKSVINTPVGASVLNRGGHHYHREAFFLTREDGR